MKSKFLKISVIFLAVFLCTFLTCQIYAQLVSFPEAEGFGKYALGARASSAPQVVHVTNLNDSGTGSFRDAVSASNRIVVFDVAGVIKISSRIVVSSNIYIAGQTAPGEGITVYGNGFSFSNADNVICRYLRIRMGAVGDSGKDALGIAEGSNMIFDHVSVSWGRDETFSVSGEACVNITIQNSIISQGLLSHSAGGLIQTDGGVTLYRNLYVDNDTRNNKIKGVNQYVNNIVYNWSSGAYIMGGDSEGQSYANCESNYFINGPLNSVAALGGANANFHIYADDNWWDKNRNGIVDGYLVPQNEYSGGPDFQTVRYNYPVLPKWSANMLIDSVLPFVGASLPYRDLADCYVVNEVRSFGKGGNVISNENELSIGIPTSWNVWTGTKRTDTDNDGMPDAWEDSNGLNKVDATDAVKKAVNGYLNIENYINGITSSYSQDFLRAPLNLTTDSITQNNIYLTWFDFTDKEIGYCIEQKIGGTFTEITRTNKNISTFNVAGLTPEQSYVFRVRGYNAGGYSTYSNELTVKTKPVPVAVTDLTTYTPDLIWKGQNDNSWNKTSANWSGGSEIFTDNSKVLFPELVNTATISITEPVSIGTLVVNASNDYTLSGSSISGVGSVNKTGTGKLSLMSDNNYTGATVLYRGTLELNKIANGGLPSSIGASPNYDFNLVLKGGKLSYTGASVSTDRSIVIENNPEISIETNGTVLTQNGIITGTGSLTKSGAGTLLSKNINTYDGTTTITNGTIEYNGVDNINASLGAGKSFVLNGGRLKTSGGSTTNYENYYADIQVLDGNVSAFEPFRNCYIYSKFSGSGKLYFDINYVREYVQGDWTQFSGIVYARGLGTATDGSQFMLNNTLGIPNGRVITSGNTKIVCWKNAGTMYLGGLSGAAGTYLAGADKQNNAATMTWIVGGTGTDETFAGIINNECSNGSYKGTTSIIKDGNGYWRLTGANIYSGTTTVRGGMLIVNGTHTGTGKITVQEGGLLGGKGTLPGAVVVLSGGVIQAGDPMAIPSNIATMTVGPLTLNAGSQTNMEINPTTMTSDKIASSGAVVFGGKLNIKNTTTQLLKDGDQFTLFSGTSFSGNFSEIIPSEPGDGLKWVFSNGVLKVVSDANGIVNPYQELIKISPNPANTFTAIRLPEKFREITLKVMDFSGKKIKHQVFTETNEISLDCRNLQKGTYLICLYSNNTIIYSDKLIKK